MDSAAPLPPLLAIVGPTGTGKSALALELAQALGAEIVNLDSRQIYRGLDIGSAKPSAAERALAPHHLYDVVAPDEPFDCARYRELARAAIADIHARGRAVVLVGGTGLYLKALRHGLFPGPPRDSALRMRLESLERDTPGALHVRLAAVDPAAAARLHPRDRLRVIRALEVHELTGRPLSDWQAAHGFRALELDIITIGLALDRADLYARLHARCGDMIAAGLVDEVRRLREAGYGPALAPLRSIGYREIGDYLDAQCSLEQAVASMAQATRRLSKRQLTWFRADPYVRWFDAARVTVQEIQMAVGSRQ